RRVSAAFVARQPLPPDQAMRLWPATRRGRNASTRVLVLSTRRPIHQGPVPRFPPKIEQAPTCDHLSHMPLRLGGFTPIERTIRNQNENRPDSNTGAPIAEHSNGPGNLLELRHRSPKPYQILWHTF